jgi:hypothetical protein
MGFFAAGVTPNLSFGEIAEVLGEVYLAAFLV